MVPYDTKRDYLVPTELIIDFIERLRPPVTIHVIETMCKALENEDNSELMDYRKLFQTNLANIVEKYLQKLVAGKEKRTNTSDEVDCDKEVVQVTSSHASNAFSTLDGEIGEWTKEIKETAFKQFKALLKYCKSHNIVLSREVAEKGILI